MAVRRIAIIFVALIVVMPLHAQTSQSIWEIVQDQSGAAEPRFRVLAPS